jgi:hypothetical protein
VSADTIAAALRQTWLHQPFGVVKFWGTSVFRPNDQVYELVSTHADGDRLDLVFVHESRAGLAGVISVWEPEGLEAAPQDLGRGIAIRAARRLAVDDSEASWDGGADYRYRDARGEASFPIESRLALVLAR